MRRLTVLLAYWQADKWLRTSPVQGRLRLRRARQRERFDAWLMQRRERLDHWVERQLTESVEVG